MRACWAASQGQSREGNLLKEQHGPRGWACGVGPGVGPRVLCIAEPPARPREYSPRHLGAAQGDAVGQTSARATLVCSSGRPGAVAAGRGRGHLYRDRLALSGMEPTHGHLAPSPVTPKREAHPSNRTCGWHEGRGGIRGFLPAPRSDKMLEAAQMSVIRDLAAPTLGPQIL